MTHLDKDQITTHARSLNDDDLVKLVATRDADYEKAAFAIYEAEIERRRLGPRVEKSRVALRGAVAATDTGKSNQRIYRLGGWLLFFFVSFIFMLLNHAMVAVFGVMFLVQSRTPLESIQEISNWRPELAFAFAVVTVIVSASLFYFGTRVALLLFAKFREGVRDVAFYMKLVFWYQVVILIITFVNFKTATAVGYAALDALYPYIWIEYLARSERVRRTFGLSENNRKLIRNLLKFR